MRTTRNKQRLRLLVTASSFANFSPCESRGHADCREDRRNLNLKRSGVGYEPVRDNSLIPDPNVREEIVLPWAGHVILFYTPPILSPVGSVATNIGKEVAKSTPYGRQYVHISARRRAACS